MPAYATERPRVPPVGAFLEGWRRVVRAPVLVLGVALGVGLTTFLLETARPASAQAALVAYWIPGVSLTAVYWLQQFYFRAADLAFVIAPEFARFLEASRTPPPSAAAFTLQAALWLFLSGGVLDRLARGRPIRAAAFFAACGVFFFRFLRLMLIAAVPGYLLLRIQQAYAGNVFMHAGILLTVAAGAVVIDFAKTRIAVEDRLSAIAALAASARFIRRRVVRVVGLIGLNAIVLFAVMRLQVQIALAPPAAWLELPVWAAVTLLAIAARLAVMASEVAFFQGELAHAGYTAAPLPVWPDSPSIEALENLVHRRDDGLR